MSENFYYRYEAKGIQGWILATDKLKELVGGSAIIDDLGDRARAHATALGLHPEDFISAAAGNATLRFPNREALQQFAGAWPAEVAHLAPGLTLVQAWVPADDAKWLRHLQEGLHAARQCGTAELPEAGPWVERAPWTGRPAERFDGDDGRKVAVDQATLLKRRAHESTRRDFEDALLKPGERFVRDADTELGEGWLAVIHADGNAVGELVMKKGNPAEIQKLSSALTEATKAAGKAATDQIRRDRNKGGRPYCPARPVVLGGDDVTIIVRGPDAMPFTRAFLQAFEVETRKWPEINAVDGLTACAGIAFVKGGYPFHLAYGLAETLCKKAKELAKPQGASALAFARVTTAMHDLERDPTPRRKAYLLSELESLQSVAKALGKLPTKPIREWLSLAVAARRAGDESAEATEEQNHWQRFREVSRRDAKLSKAIKGLDDALRPLASGENDRNALGDALSWRTIDRATALEQKHDAHRSAQGAQ
jgi:hypothetical protein